MQKFKLKRKSLELLGQFLYEKNDYSNDILPNFKNKKMILSLIRGFNKQKEINVTNFCIQHELDFRDKSPFIFKKLEDIGVFKMEYMTLEKFWTCYIPLLYKCEFYKEYIEYDNLIIFNI